MLDSATHLPERASSRVGRHTSEVRMRLTPLAVAPVAFAVGMRASSPAIPPSTASTIDHIPASALNAALDSTLGAKGCSLPRPTTARYLMNRRIAERVELHTGWTQPGGARGVGCVSLQSRQAGEVRGVSGATRLVTPTR
jgi:hypothetical protein